LYAVGFQLWHLFQPWSIIARERCCALGWQHLTMLGQILIGISDSHLYILFWQHSPAHIAAGLPSCFQVVMRLIRKRSALTSGRAVSLFNRSWFSLHCCKYSSCMDDSTGPMMPESPLAPPACHTKSPKASYVPSVVLVSLLAFLFLPSA
jgi:hypothetical protein